MKAFKTSLVVFSIFLMGQPLLIAQASAASETVTVDSHAFINETLELTVSGQAGSQLKFDVKSSSSGNSPQAQIAVNVTSNSGNPYQVSQQIQNALENANGDELSADNILFTSAAQHSGGTAVNSETVLGNIPQMVYSSDASGNSNTVVINYTLQAPDTQPPGDYSGSITFTASSI